MLDNVQFVYDKEADQRNLERWQETIAETDAIYIFAGWPAQDN